MKQTKPLLQETLEQFADAAGRVARLEFGAVALLSLAPVMAIAVALSYFDPRWGGAVAVVTWLVTVVLWWRRRPVLATAAGRAAAAELLAPELGAAARAAVDLERRLGNAADATEPQNDFSENLAGAYIATTSRRLDDLRLGSLYRRQRMDLWRRASPVLVGGLVAALVVCLAADRGRRRLLDFLSDPAAAHLSDVPLAADIRLHYQYPQYTGRPARVLEGTDGSVSAVAGTMVQLRAVSRAPVTSAWLELEDLEGAPQQRISLEVSDGRVLHGSFLVARNGRYGFSVVTEEGDRLMERQRRAVVAEVDAYPEAYMDEPAVDVEIRDSESVALLWRARDDFGLSQVTLLVREEGGGPGQSPPVPGPGRAQEGAAVGDQTQRIELFSSAGTSVERSQEGRYTLSFAQLALSSAADVVTIQLEVIDSDTVAGPKKALSSVRRISLYSARRHHQKMMDEQRQVLDAMVDWLADELTAPLSLAAGPTAQALAAEQHIAATIADVESEISNLLQLMADDSLAKPQVVQAFRNIAVHVRSAKNDRGVWLQRLAKRQARVVQGMLLARQGTVAQLEKDIIYLDDLLALQRIDELKDTAKDLLAAQRDLQQLLADYRATNDPALKKELERRIDGLRQQMMSLLSRMADIKQHLPGEYRNMESASMLQMDEQLGRLEKMLAKGDFEAAAQELEQLANMIENMVSRIDDAEQEYGGERYEQMRQQLQQFSKDFSALENEQRALAERSEKMLAAYRKKAVEKAGKNLDDVIAKARAATARAQQEAGKIAANGELVLQEAVEREVRALSDLDALLESKDLAEARRAVAAAVQEAERIEELLQVALWNDPDAARVKASRAAVRRALVAEEEVRELLDQVFGDPNKVLSAEQRQRLQRMAERQQRLRQRAADLQQQMEKMAEEMPLFGEDMQASMDQAAMDMDQAAGEMGRGTLPGGAQHSRRASNKLKRLRESVEQASQQGQGQGQGGMPMPFAASGSGQGDGQSRDTSLAPLHLPPGRAKEGFRQELLEAAKHKPAAGYEEAVQRYYKELIR